jgi:hypothetical protein
MKERLVTLEDSKQSRKIVKENNPTEAPFKPFKALAEAGMGDVIKKGFQLKNEGKISFIKN